LHIVSLVHGLDFVIADEKNSSIKHVAVKANKSVQPTDKTHENYIEFFHNDDPNNFIKQQTRDQLKKGLCEENQIASRYVWYYGDPHIVIPEHLRKLSLIEC